MRDRPWSLLRTLVLPITALCLVVAACRGFAGGTVNTPPQCTGGARLVNNACYCATGTTWNGLTCQGTPVAGTCGGGSYPFGPEGFMQCYCLDGFKADNGQCVELQCAGGSVASGDQCVCPQGTQWDGAQCATPPALTCGGGAVPSGDQCVCPDGTQWDGAQCAAQQALTCNGGAVPSGDQCVCPDGTQWDGAQCVASPVEPTAPAARRMCRNVILEKGYGPSTLNQCNGVNNRCAIAVLDKGYGPSALENCRNVEATCAEAVLEKGYGPSALSNCVRVDGGCAVAVLNQGYGPSSLGNCKRR